MSVLIKGMKMPKNCNGCDFMCCLRHFNILNDDRPSDCPIIAELPEKHGDLIDRNYLIKESLAEGAYGYVDTKEIYDAPAIIKAEGD